MKNLNVSSMAYILHPMHSFNYTLGRPFKAQRWSKEEIISQQQWDSLSVSGVEPIISVRAAVTAWGPMSPEGLVVATAANLSQLQHASNFGKGRGRERERETETETE